MFFFDFDTDMFLIGLVLIVVKLLWGFSSRRAPMNR